MKVSIITINFNNKLGLEKTISSVINQTYSNIEYIVIDGGSTDGSVDVIKENTNDVYYWVSEPDNGIYHAMNKGITNSNGDYLIFLNSGDYFFHKGIIQQCCEFIDCYPENDVYYGDIIVVNNKDYIEEKVYKYPSKITLNYFKENTINHQASFISSTLFQEYGYYSETYKLASDFKFFLLVILNNRRFKHIGFPIVFYDYTGLSSLNDFKEYKKEKLSIWRDLVPDIVNEVIEENREYKHLLEYKIIKAAIFMNSKIQSFKGNK